MLRILDHAVDDQREGLREGERSDACDQPEDERDGETRVIRPRFP
jgi:hypothetical protein